MDKSMKKRIKKQKIRICRHCGEPNSFNQKTWKQIKKRGFWQCRYCKAFYEVPKVK